MSPEDIRRNDMKCLAGRTLDALGVNCKVPDQTTIMQHSIGQACLELEAVEKVLEREMGEVALLVYVVMGIRQRLELAAHCGGILASMVADGEQAHPQPPAEPAS